MRLVIFPAVFIFLAPLFGVAFGQTDTEFDVVGYDRRPVNRPDMPSVAEAERVTRTETVVHYPRLVAIAGFGVAGISSDAATESFDRVMETVGLESTAGLSDGFQHFHGALRLDINYRWRVAADGSLGGIGADDIEDFHRFGLMVSRAMTPERSHGVCLSAGAGIGWSQIEYKEDYSRQIPGSSYYLFNTHWRSARRTVFPVQVVLEIPNLRRSALGVMMSFTYQFGPENTETLRLSYEGGSADVPMEVNLSGWLISFGLTSGF